MKDHFEKKIVNPSRSSIREESLELQKEPDHLDRLLGYVPSLEYIDLETGETFYKVTKHPEVQRFVSMTCKGIINTADVVLIGDDYYSHSQNPDHLEQGDNHFKSEVLADVFILDNVFGDYDHKFYSNNSLDQWTQHKNIYANAAQKKSVYFDFDQSRDLFFTNQINKDDADSVQAYENRVNDNFQKMRRLAHDKKNFASAALIIGQKARTFTESLFSDDKLDYFKKIIDRSFVKDQPETLDGIMFEGYQFDSSDIDMQKQQLFNDMKKRLEIVERLSEKYTA